MQRSVIRELLKLTHNPDIISFAGGLPAPQTFPVEYVKRATAKVLEEEHVKALQYGATEGDPRLRKKLAEIMKRDGIDADPDQILVTTASQQGLEIMAKIFFNPGDTCIVGLPTYLGGLQSIKSYGGVPVGVELDEHGMIPEKLVEMLDKLEAEGRRPRLIYLIPDFQNPAGVTIPLERRKEIVKIARDRDYIIVEDTPYRQIRFEGEHQQTFQSLAPERVLSLYTFSKIMLPGFRLGWAYGPEWLINKFIMAKQSMDLCTPPFNQAVTYHMLEEGALEAGLKIIIKLYHSRCNVMLEELEKNLGDLEGVSWTKPEGGLFLWLTLPEGMDTDELFKKAIEKNVAYVPGSAFFPKNEDHRSMRLNFSYSNEEKIREGCRRLGKLIKEYKP
ncbi:MAG: PLP-dependent aminotransferase family protein [Candidatus Sabulitectum sp.]|nr:PLP-dependent aminotransferase family protein [Candidatus Sabulitectum sp.]